MPAKSTSKGPTFAVVGAGAMGRITVGDLAATAPAGSTILVADRDERTTRAVARDAAAIARPRKVAVRAVPLDVSDPRRAARVFREERVFAVVCALSHHLNLQVMQAALAARVHYCDLGGLFHVTRKQLAQNAAWRKADRLALLGMGAAPGITNVLARSVADTLDEVHELHVQVGSVDLTPDSDDAGLGVSYAIETVLEEASCPAALFTDGKLSFVPALGGLVDVRFPPPVGLRHPALTLHSEVATLPESYRRKGLRECSFRIAFDDDLVDRLLSLRSLGLLSGEPVLVPGHDGPVIPRAVTAAVLRGLSSPAAAPPPESLREYEILRVVVRGTRAGAPAEETLDCHTTGMPERGVGIDIDTGAPPSIAVQMLARGEITARGCLPPERAVPPGPFFQELELRGMKLLRG